MRKFGPGRYGWDLFMLKMPIFGHLVEKNIVARTTRTLGTLVASGVPILEAINITKETSGNAVFENLYQKVHEAIREGESIATPMKDYSQTSFHPVALFFWFAFIAGPIGALLYITRMNSRILDDMVVNMVDVGEETGELDTMLYKVADNYDEEVGGDHREPDASDGAAVDHRARRHRGLHRDRPVPAADRADHQAQRWRRRVRAQGRKPQTDSDVEPPGSRPARAPWHVPLGRRTSSSRASNRK